MPVYRINEKRLNFIINAHPNKLITVYTLQHADALKLAVSRGYLTGDNDKHLKESDFVEQYDWMRDQMKTRIPDFSGDYPIWCHLGTISPTFTKVCIKARVPRKRILLSHYHRWEEVLNFWPLALDPESEDPNTDLIPLGGFPDIASVPDIVKDTWTRVFDLNQKTNKYHDASQVQACVDRIFTSEIVSVTTRYKP